MGRPEAFKKGATWALTFPTPHLTLTSPAETFSQTSPHLTCGLLRQDGLWAIGAGTKKLARKRAARLALLVAERAQRHGAGAGPLELDHPVLVKKNMPVHYLDSILVNQCHPWTTWTTWTGYLCNDQPWSLPGSSCLGCPGQGDPDSSGLGRNQPDPDMKVLV